MRARLIACFGLLPVPVAADALILEGTAGKPGDTVIADISLRNDRRIVGMQFQLRLPTGQAAATGALALDGMERHRVNTRVEEDRLKVVVHSPTNAELPGGGVLSIPLSLGSGSPSGGPAVTVENLIFTNAAGQFISGAVFYHPLEAWRQERFTDEQRLDPNIVGDLADPDDDGFSNLMEFLFGTDPLQSDDDGIAAQRIGRRGIEAPDGTLVPGPAVFSFDFPRAKGVEGVDLWIESSEDLVNWTREAVEAVRAGSSDSVTERMRLVIESDPASSPRRFFRVGAARAEEATPQPGFVPKISYASWITRYFSAETLTNPGIAGEQADPDKDGMVNLMEYLFGSDPNVAATTALPTAGLVINGGVRTAELRYGVSREAEGVFLLAEASTNLQTWKPVEYREAPTGRASGLAIEMAQRLEGEAPERQFFRFRAARSLGTGLPFSSWLPRHFSGADLNDAAITGSQADPDGDGIVNLMEYYLGSDPNLFSPGMLPVPSVSGVGNQRRASLGYGRFKDAQGVTLRIEGSEDLINWSPRTFQEVPAGPSTETTVRIKAEIDGVAPERQFFRFEVLQE
jgi:hypothetical protein